MAVISILTVTRKHPVVHGHLEDEAVSGGQPAAVAVRGAVEQVEDVDDGRTRQRGGAAAGAQPLHGRGDDARVAHAHA